MENYNYIIDVNSGERHSIFSETGRTLLKSYIQTYKSGGNWLTKLGRRLGIGNSSDVPSVDVPFDPEDDAELKAELEKLAEEERGHPMESKEDGEPVNMACKSLNDNGQDYYACRLDDGSSPLDDEEEEFSFKCYPGSCALDNGYTTADTNERESKADDHDSSMILKASSPPPGKPSAPFSVLRIRSIKSGLKLITDDNVNDLDEQKEPFEPITIGTYVDEKDNTIRFEIYIYPVREYDMIEYSIYFYFNFNEEGEGKGKRFRFYNYDIFDSILKIFSNWNKEEHGEWEESHHVKDTNHRVSNFNELRNNIIVILDAFRRIDTEFFDDQIKINQYKENLRYYSDPHKIKGKRNEIEKNIMEIIKLENNNNNKKFKEITLKRLDGTLEEVSSEEIVERIQEYNRLIKESRVQLRELVKNKNSKEEQINTLTSTMGSTPSLAQEQRLLNEKKLLNKVKNQIEQVKGRIKTLNSKKINTENNILKIIMED